MRQKQGQNKRLRGKPECFLQLCNCDAPARRQGTTGGCKSID